MSYLKQKFRNIKKFPTWIFWPLVWLMRLMRILFYRVEIIDPHDFIHTGHGLISVTWHNRLFAFPVVFPRAARRCTAAVISASRDGQYLSDFVSLFGIKSIRGSSSKRGAAAQLAAIRFIKDGYNVAFTPDGPRGPKYHLHKGPVHLASTTGTQIVPIMLNYSRYWSIKSWDNFQIPKPFIKIKLILGDPITIPPDLTPQELEDFRQRVESALLAITID
ncbi:MAG: lysophospholipid acyltransferase family protein [Victivallaceae bacterium]